MSGDLGTTQSGPILGGTPIVVTGLDLGMEDYQDDFNDGTIDPLMWTETTANDAYAVEDSGLSLYSTGGSGQVTLRSVDTSTFCDVEVTFRLGHASARTSAAEASFWLGFYISASSYFRVSVVRVRSGYALRLNAVIGSVDTLNIDLPYSALTDGKLRLVRHEEIVIVFVGGQKLIEAAWSSTAASVEIGASSTVGASMHTFVHDYVRRPSVRFGDVPMTDFSFLASQYLIGRTPPAAHNATVDVSVVAGATSYTLDSQFEYTSTTELSLGTAGAALVLVDRLGIGDAP